MGAALQKQLRYIDIVGVPSHGTEFRKRGHAEIGGKAERKANVEVQMGKRLCHWET